jgi:hypothetical protein
MANSKTDRYPSIKGTTDWNATRRRAYSVVPRQLTVAILVMNYNVKALY